MWRLRLLGDIDLTSGNRSVRRLRATKYAHVLALLSIHPGRAFGREELAETFWPDKEPESARLCLRTALASLRRQLDEPHLFLSGSRDLVRVNSDLISTDVFEFEEAVRIGSPKARELYQGEFLPGCYDDWAVLERLRLDALFSQASQEPLISPDELDRPVRNISTLPFPASKFYGREAELLEVAGTAQDSRLISIIGLGGIGKTRFAIELARRLEPEMRVVFVPLPAGKETFLLSNAIADALGTSKSPIETLEDRLDSELQPNSCLLVLDGFDQLAGESSAREWLERRLSKVRSLRIVVTSRIPIGAEGERLVHLEPMKLEDAREMFLDRARAVLPDFPRHQQLDQLCLQLERIPLSIVLCAARANVLNTSGMLQSLDHRFEVLQSARPGAGKRQSSLLAVLDWTCPVEHPLHEPLCQLTVFRSGWTFEAATAVLGENALDLLSALQQRSLIGVESTAEGNRFSMLDAVREYARQTSEPSVLDSAAVRHADYYRAVARNLASLHESDQWKAFRALDTESANIFTAFETGLGLDPERQLETLKALHFSRWCLWVRGHERSLRRVYRLAEARLEHSTGEVRAWLLRLSGIEAGHREEYRVAVDRIDEAVRIFLELGDCGSACDSLQAAAHLCEKAQDLDGAIRRIEREVQLIGADDLHARNIALAGLAYMYLNPKGNVDRAYEIYLELERFWADQPNGNSHLAVIHQGIATCLCAKGEVDQAIVLLQSSLDVFKRLGETERETLVWEVLGRAYEMSGQSDLAQAARIEACRLR